MVVCGCAWMQNIKTFDARVRCGLRLAQGGCGCGACGGCEIGHDGQARISVFGAHAADSG
jgi:hypothetical protein